MKLELSLPDLSEEEKISDVIRMICAVMAIILLFILVIACSFIFIIEGISGFSAVMITRYLFIVAVFGISSMVHVRN